MSTRKEIKLLYNNLKQDKSIIILKLNNGNHTVQKRYIIKNNFKPMQHSI